MTQTIDLKLRGIRIYNDSEIQLGVFIPEESGDLSDPIKNGLEGLGWNDTGSRFKDLDNETAMFTKKLYPIQESVTVTCGGNCKGLVTSHNYPLHNKVEGRMVIPATVINSKDTPLQCKITEGSIECTIPNVNKVTDPTGNADSFNDCFLSNNRLYCPHQTPENTNDPIDPKGVIAPKYRYFSIRETDEFDGDVFVDDQILTDNNDNIKDYCTWVRYSPDKDKRGFKKYELSKLKKVSLHSCFKEYLRTLDIDPNARIKVGGPLHKYKAGKRVLSLTNHRINPSFLNEKLKLKCYLFP
ncbi:MAG: hypothetical protein ACTSR8_00420 [Promethearchaeota archaeon]